MKPWFVCIVAAGFAHGVPPPVPPRRAPRERRPRPLSGTVGQGSSAACTFTKRKRASGRWGQPGRSGTSLVCGGRNEPDVVELAVVEQHVCVCVGCDRERALSDAGADQRPGFALPVPEADAAVAEVVW